MLARNSCYSLFASLATFCGALIFGPKRQYCVWKPWGLLAAGLLVCTSLRAGDTPQTPLILSLPLAQLSLWDIESTDGFVEQLQGNNNGNKRQSKKQNKKQMPWSQEQVNHVRFLFGRLLRDKVTIKKTLPELLTKAEPRQRSTLCRKCLHYFLHAGPDEISTTGGLTSMVRTPSDIKNFVKRPLGSIRRVARSSPLSAITSMYNRNGFPASSRKVSGFLSWKCWWQQDEGDKKTLDRALLRVFSSMFNSRGLPTVQAVETYLGLEYWWLQEGDMKILDRELLRAFSSMFNGRGLPRAQEVKDYLEWDVWWQQKGDRRVLDRELLRAFSSMFCGKGLPGFQAVKTYLEWDVWWQKEGDVKTLDRELLRAFSSMFHGKGLPSAEEVKNYLDLDVWWQERGDEKILDRELLRAFSSMFHSKGLPSTQEVKIYLDLDIWWLQKGDNRILDRELLRAFSSMLNGKGLPKAREVEAYLDLDIWWHQEGDKRILDRELLRAFASMFCGKGLPSTRAVKTYLEQDVWWRQEGDKKILDRKLLRVFSSMFSGRGLPKAWEVKDYLARDVWWQQEGDERILDRDLLRTFSSMFNGKGLPKADEVEAYLDLDVWWHQEGDKRILDRDLLRAFSSMFNSKGLPSTRAVKTYLERDVWWRQEGDKKILDRELLRAISSMSHGKGLPDIRQSRKLIDWLSVEGQPDRHSVHLMVSLYSGAFCGHKNLGLPDLDRLKAYEQNLCALLQLPFGEREGGCVKGDAKGDASNPVRVKQVALFLANKGGTRHLRWTDCVAFFDSLPSSWPRDPLETLCAVLRLQGGGAGVQAWLNIQKTGIPEAVQTFFQRAMVQGVPLEKARYAVNHIDQCDWQDYIGITRDFGRCPDSEEWATTKGFLRAWHGILPWRELQIRYLMLIQRLPEHKRESFLAAESLQAVLKSLPTLHLMNRMVKTCSDKELVNVFQSCIDYDQALKSGNVPSFRTLSVLFHALLRIKAPFFLRPPQPLSGQTLINIEDVADTGVMININPEAGIQDTETLIWRFLVTVMDALRDIEYKTDCHQLTLYPHGSDHEQTFLIPQLAEGSSGLYIRNWSRDDLLRFFRTTEWDESLFKSSNSHEREISFAPPQGVGKDISIVKKVRDCGPVYEPRREQHRRQQDAALKKNPGEPPSEPALSFGMLQGLLKNKVHLNRHGWHAADFHKERLSPDMLDLLRKRVAKASRDNVPDTLREYLASRYGEPEAENSEGETGDPLPLLAQDTTVLEPEPEPEFPPHSVEDLIAAACRRDALELTELEELARFREQLTLEQTVQIIQRIPAFLPETVLSQWIDLQREKIPRAMVEDPLPLSSDKDIRNTLFEGSDDWLEAL